MKVKINLTFEDNLGGITNTQLVIDHLTTTLPGLFDTLNMALVGSKTAVCYVIVYQIVFSFS